jgi:hypothetical protein
MQIILYRWPTLKEQNILTDVALVSKENQPFPCHKVMLAAQSDYFKAMFTGSFREAKQWLTLKYCLSIYS